MRMKDMDEVLGLLILRSGRGSIDRRRCALERLRRARWTANCLNAIFAGVQCKILDIANLIRARTLPAKYYRIA